MVADKDYTLSFTRSNLVTPTDTYHFQLCRKQAKSPVCFNPFYAADKIPAEFTVLPDVGHLHAKGLVGKSLRYAAQTTGIVAILAISLVLAPKAVLLAFSKLFKVSKLRPHKGSDEVIERMVHNMYIKARGKGKKVSYEQLRKEKQAALAVLQSKPARYFISLFIVDGLFTTWYLGFNGWRSLTNQLDTMAWGQKELDLANAYPYLHSDSDTTHTATSVEQLLIALRNHLQLTFSDAYLNEFNPPDPEPVSDGE